jgi:hypothetical protein
MKFFYSTLLTLAVIPAAFADYYGNQNSGYGYGQTEATSAGNAGATGKFSMTINAEGNGYMSGAADGNASTQGVVDAKANETGK